MLKRNAEMAQGSILPTLINTGFTIAHSLRARGAARSALFAALGVGLPVIAEHISINVRRDLRHHTHPQIQGVPVGAALGWYNIVYATFAMTESLFTRGEITQKQRRWVLPLATTAVATSLDLTMDCMGLDLGLWEWKDGGPYAVDIAGPNGKRGIPLFNFGGWLFLATSVTGLYELLAKDRPVTPYSGRAGSVEAGRTAALLLLPYYGVSAAWAVQRRKPKYLLPSLLVPLVIGVALRGNTTHHKKYDE
jgi:uncharacterized membrane protein